MSKVAFINPPFLKGFSRYSRSPCVTRGGTLYYPVMLALGTGYLQKNGHEVLLIDAIAENKKTREVLSKLTNFKPDIIVIETSTPSINKDINFAKESKRLMNRAKIVLVGRHFNKKETAEKLLKKEKEIDIIARKEFYDEVLDLANKKSLRSIKGITYIQNKKIKSNIDGKPINPDDLPFVSKIYKEFLDYKKYFYASLRYPYLMLQFGYGCPFGCAFCNEMHHASYRHRSIKNFIEELEYIEKNFPDVKELHLDDPTFYINNEITKELCEVMIKKRFKFKWSTNVRCNVPLDILKLMKKAGCRLVHVGIENINQDVLTKINKGIKSDTITRFLFDAKKAGILVHACFIMGLPGDTEITLRKTLDYAKAVPLDSIQAFPLIPTPGELSYDWAKNKGYLISEDYSQWLNKNGGYNCVISRPDLTKEQVEWWAEKFYKEFIFRISFVLYKIKQSLKSWQEFKRNFKTFLKFRGYKK